MTADEILVALKSAGTATPAVMRAGVPLADAIAPAVYDRAHRFADGIFLIPEDSDVLFHGLHILAAARHPGLCECLLLIARQPGEDVDRLFPTHVSQSLARLLLSVWDRDSAFLFRLIEHGDLDADVKWGLFDLLSRLTFDGRIPRAETAAFLARIEQDSLIDDDDDTWYGWEQAVTRLGLTSLEPALQRVWSKPVYKVHTTTDKDAMFEVLRTAAASPADPEPFERDNIKPVDDPAEGIAWVEHRAAMLKAMATGTFPGLAALVPVAGDATAGVDDDGEDDGDDDDGVDDDPAQDISLTSTEFDWLEGFLTSRQAPGSTMTLEMLDGFLTALVIGPVLIMPSSYLPVIWGTEDGEGPVWDSQEQLQFFMTLVTKHWNAIATRRVAKAPHVPLIDEFAGEETAAEWSQGFQAGIELASEAWDPIFSDRRAQDSIMPVLALGADLPDDVAAHLTPEVRATLVEGLPCILQNIALYWEKPRARPRPLKFMPAEAPVRSTKVARNDPCPCGSGKKYKKCCGAGGPVH